MNVVIVDHWPGKSVNSDSLTDKELKQPLDPSKDGLFSVRFLRCRPELFFIACRVLDGEQGAEETVHGSFRVDSCTAREFADEGTFRNWLLTVLIDEALLIRHCRDEVNVGKDVLEPMTTSRVLAIGGRRTSWVLERDE
jgi:hypothetical protein